jgi:hypothetical protein
VSFQKTSLLNFSKTVFQIMALAIGVGSTLFEGLLLPTEMLSCNFFYFSFPSCITAFLL